MFVLIVSRRYLEPVMSPTVHHPEMDNVFNSSARFAEDNGFELCGSNLQDMLCWSWPPLTVPPRCSKCVGSGSVLLCIIIVESRARMTRGTGHVPQMRPALASVMEIFEIHQARPTPRHQDDSIVESLQREEGRSSIHTAFDFSIKRRITTRRRRDTFSAITAPPRGLLEKGSPNS